MDRLNTRVDHRSVEQFLDKANGSGRMAGHFSSPPRLNSSFAAPAQDARTHAIHAPAPTVQHLVDYDWSRIRRTGLKVSSPSDIGYFRVRAAKELRAAARATDERVRRVHLEMAERYQALISKAGGDLPARLHAVAS